MRGIILAGGTGSRLGPLTRSVNKHVLPVGDRPMIAHAYRVLLDNGIKNITIVSTPRGVGQIAEQIGSGLCETRASYRVQDKPGGIADALRVAVYEDSHEPTVVILGDNMFLPSPVISFDQICAPATCFLKRIDDPEKLKEFGVPKIDFGTIVRIDEKPEKPASTFAVTGLYVFGAGLYGKLRGVQAGPRGEAEITDLLNLYAREGTLLWAEVPGFWGDAGTVEGMRECSEACLT